jgi:hypothetical protein
MIAKYSNQTIYISGWVNGWKISILHLVGPVTGEDNGYQVGLQSNTSSKIIREFTDTLDEAKAALFILSDRAGITSKLDRDLINSL